MSLPRLTSSPETNTLSPRAAVSVTAYNARAPKYDSANGGWHVTLGADYITWLSAYFLHHDLELQGAKVLDLACGTGLVTFPAAQAIGHTGRVIGVDISPGMLEVAQKKLDASEKADLAPVELVKGDITDLSTLKIVTDVVRDEKGWDVITVCSAVPLIGDVEAALKHWRTLLKPDGVLMFDVPTEDRTAQHLLTIDVPERMGKPLTFDRRWVRDLASVEDTVDRSGLRVKKAWRTRSYVPEKAWRDNQADEVWHEHVLKHGANYANMVEGLDSDKARQIWRDCFRENLRADGMFVEGHWLYVVMATKQ